LDLYLGAFIAFALVMAGMAVGVISSDREITGSCGGLANMKTDDGEPLCECGARPGESCGTDPELQFEVDGVGDDDTDHRPVPTARHAEPETAAV
jgi:hypothetical protein